jgi:hypothetical protein
MARSWRLLASAATLALTSAGLPTSAADPSPGGGFVSSNVTWVANIPVDTGGIGGRVLQVGDQRRFYVSGARGLSIYDVTDPALPVPLGTLNLPHFENESFAVADDGNTVFLTSDPSFGQPPVTYVIDTTIPAAPLVASVIPDGAHTATCANPKCTHLYGERGWIYDVTDRKNPKQVEGHLGAVHYSARDAAGLLWDAGTVIDPRKNPAKPKRSRVGAGGWHNQLRPNAEKWKPRKKGDTSKTLRPGEIVIGSDETWLTPGFCDESSAGISTWSIVDFDKGKRAKKVATIKPVNGMWTDGSPAFDVVGCSAHWFDYRKGMVAAGWYDHGVRFIKVNEKTGAMQEVGFFQPAYSLTWAAYWVDDEYVYTVDAVRGIDILRFDRKAAPPAGAQLARSWTPVTFELPPAATREVYTCRRAASN